MLPGRYDLTLYQGDYWVQPLGLYVDYGTTEVPDERPVDLTGATVEAEIRTDTANTSVMAVFTTTVTDPVNGQLVLSLPGEQASRLIRNGVWDLQVINAAGQTQTWLYGDVAVIREVTR